AALSCTLHRPPSSTLFPYPTLFRSPKYFDGGLSATVVPRKPKGSHRHLVEYGTKSRYTKKGQYRGKMPKIPFMAPAEKAAEGQYNKKLKEIVDRDKVV